MAIMLAVDVLGCTGTTEERAGLLHKIIQIAAELRALWATCSDLLPYESARAAAGVSSDADLDGITAATHRGAILYEKTLRPFMKSLNDGRESCPLAAPPPHVLPLLSLEKSYRG
ncbi:hypothetical protein FQN60_017884 [Etheostoma spectabile]|uniref:Uncharacterized protein n=1 Tax=Etheostoma spectabile TaxID=54343 RepID=A0A5J5DGR0_9PERO|nr:hypothetical protein FQN60_017884 [Etheostoma spectabile]